MKQTDFNFLYKSSDPKAMAEVYVESQHATSAFEYKKRVLLTIGAYDNDRKMLFWAEVEKLEKEKAKEDKAEITPEEE